MALPNSGAISFSHLQNEYGGGRPISLGNFYRGGSRVLTQRNTYVLSGVRFNSSNKIRIKTNQGGSSSPTTYDKVIIWDGVTYSDTEGYFNDSIGFPYVKGAYRGSSGGYSEYEVNKYILSGSVPVNTTVPSSGKISLSNFYGQGN